MRLPQVDTIAITDIDPNKGFEIVKQFVTNPLTGQPLKFENLAPFAFYERGLDIVSVATPASTHLEVVRRLLENSPPGLIFSEKPLATTMDDAKEIVNHCSEKGVKLAVNCTRRWDPVWQKAWQVVHEDIRDTPNMAVAHFTGDPIEVGIHMGDIINWFGLDRCCEVFDHRDVEYLIFELDILFPKKRVRISANGQRLEIGRVIDSTRYDGVKELKLEIEYDTTIQAEFFPPIGGTFGSPMYQACRQLATCLDRDEEPLCTGRMGLAALERVLRWKKSE